MNKQIKIALAIVVLLGALYLIAQPTIGYGMTTVYPEDESGLVNLQELEVTSSKYTFREDTFEYEGEGVPMTREKAVEAYGEDVVKTTEEKAMED